MISVIIPALNEAGSLGQVIAAVGRENAVEIVLVDAGSADTTTSIARQAGAEILHSPRRQRAFQLNLGARKARGGVLLFLHADTVLPRNAASLIRHALRDRRVVGGAFARNYDSPSLVLRVTCFLAGLRNRLIGWHLGDQAMFVRAKEFFQLGGFREVDRFEDLDFSRRLRRFGRTVTLRARVTSSPRRFERRGAATTTLHDFALTMGYLVRGLPRPRPAAVASSPTAYESAERIRSL
ncbi:MAG: TIGR04283 family arsenosugar biosynthesis glycosyltransferase [Verrucomicrobiota bacterium]